MVTTRFFGIQTLTLNTFANNMRLKTIQEDAYNNSKAHGFWEKKRNKGEMLCLIHSEVSECLEATRQKKMPMDDHIPKFTQEAAELADIIIRVGDYAQGFGIDLEKVLKAKMTYNLSRPYKHGKKH